MALGISGDKYTLVIGATLNTSKIVGQLKELESTSKINIGGDGLKKGTTQVRKFTDEADNAVKVIQKFDAQGNLLSSTITQDSVKMQTFGARVKALGAGFMSTLGKVAKFGAATAIIGGVTTAVYQAASAVKEYDDALTQFKKVSNLSGDALNEYGVKLGKLGESVAKSRIEMVEASTEFRKSGYSDSDSAKLAKTASLYQNIADEEISAGDAASLIISQMKAFNMNASQSEHTIDAVNEV